MTMTDGGTAWRKGQDRYGNGVAQQMMVCDNCGSASIAAGLMLTEYTNPRTALDSEDRDELPFGITWLPEGAVGRDFPDVPPHIASAADEAYRCHSIQAYRAAGSLARAVVEATAKDKEITKGQLHEKIDALAAADLIRPSIQAAAHEVRYFGNNMAHGDFVQDTAAEESAEALELMAMVLREVYQEPAAVARVQAARQAKKAGTARAEARPLSDEENRAAVTRIANATG